MGSVSALINVRLTFIPWRKILGIYGAQDDVVPAFLAEYALDEMKSSGHGLTMKETPHGHELHPSYLQEVRDFLGD